MDNTPVGVGMKNLINFFFFLCKQRIKSALKLRGITWEDTGI